MNGIYSPNLFEIQIPASAYVLSHTAWYNGKFKQDTTSLLSFINKNDSVANRTRLKRPNAI